MIVYCLCMKYLFAAEIYQWCKSLHRVKNNFQEHYIVDGKFCFFSFIYLLIEVLSCLKRRVFEAHSVYLRYTGSL